jgi:tyrosyl-tRNA synthetase
MENERIDLLDELAWRGLLHQCTDEGGLREHLGDPDGSPRKVYAGFDPTADSLTIGNLVPIMLLAHVKRAGHVPVVLMGGGTGLIGDPSGKSAERTLMTADIVAENVVAQKPIFHAVLGGVDGPEYVVLNNAEWLCGLGYIEALRDIGKHFSVNMMMQKESVKERLHNREQGISYTEFSYMILQAYDFAYMYEHEDITVQAGGSDQFGNIVAGIDLVRRMHAAESGGEHDSLAFGLTAPLVTKADGGKFGKTESGAIWLTAARTSPYAYFQFWLNTSDEDVGKFLRTFTFLDRAAIEALEAEHAENPGLRVAQKALAREATTILHGEKAATQAEAAGRALFSGDLAALDEPTLREVFANVPSSEHARTQLAEGVDPLELLVETGLAKSKREGREFLAAGSVSVNGVKIGPDTRLDETHLLHGSLIALRRGKKAWHLTRWA